MNILHVNENSKNTLNIVKAGEGLSIAMSSPKGEFIEITLSPIESTLLMNGLGILGFNTPKQ